MKKPLSQITFSASRSFEIKGATITEIHNQIRCGRWKVAGGNPRLGRSTVHEATGRI